MDVRAEEEQAMFRMPMLVLVITVFLGALIEPDAVRTQASTPAPLLPAATAPLNLGTVTLPDNEEGVSALFGRLPATVAGEPRADYLDGQTDRVIAAYGTVDLAFGPPLSLQVLDFTTGDFFPREFTAGEFVASAAGTSDYDTVAFGQDDTLAWIQAETTAGVAGNMPGTPTISRRIYTLAWGEATGSRLFTAAAFSPEGLAALISAFVMAAESQPATPTVEATPVAHWRRE